MLRYFYCKLSVLNLDNVARADVGTMSALYALGYINHCQVVSYYNCVCGAFALALHAADAACFANLIDSSTLVVAGASDFDMLVIRYELDNLLRAGIDTSAAADTLLAVNLCDTINDVHCAELAGVSTVAEADAGKAAIHIALAAEQHSCLAVFRSSVVEALYSMAFSTGAGNECDLLDSFACGNAHNISDFCSCLGACCNTLVGGCFALCNCCCIAITAGEATAAAVCACEALADCCLLGINFNMENLRCKCKNCTEDCA